MACRLSSLRTRLLLPISYQLQGIHCPLAFFTCARHYSSSLWKPWARKESDVSVVDGPMPLFEPTDLRHRDLLDFSRWTRDDIYTLMWIALDLKARSPEDCRTLCLNKTVIILYESLVTKTAILKSIAGTGAVASSLHLSLLDKDVNMEFFAKSLAVEANALFIEGSQFTAEKLQELADVSSIPVINIRSVDYTPLAVLAECITLYEHYNYLRRLQYSYAGHVDNPFLRTYVTLFPKLGIHFRYTTNDELLPDEIWARGVRLATRGTFKTDFHQCNNFEEVVDRTHVIATAFKNQSEDSTAQPFRLTIKHMEEAHLNWVFLHHDIHKGTYCKADLLKAKQCLVWRHLDNIRWIAMAALVASTVPYTPKDTPVPTFLGKL